MDGPTRWDADGRTRSQTRAVLMAISRDRSWYFVTSIPWTLFWAVATFGLLPMLDAARRFDRWRRLEWIQYGEVMSWIADRTGDAEARALADEATTAAGKPSRRTAVRVLATLSLAVLAGAAWRGGVRGLLTTAFWPASLDCAAITFAIIVAGCWLANLIVLERHQTWIERWLACASEVLNGYDKRPVVSKATAMPWPWIIIAIALAAGGLVWAGAQVAVLTVQNRYVRSTRSVRMRFAERTLEWMDETGLPVEFDVEALKPEEIAAKLA